MEATVGNTIKGYEVQERIGTGGFGAVYRAYQTTVGREVVIKCILPSLANRPEFIRRFETEAQIIARLEHLHIVPLYDYWRDPEGAYLVMRYLRGGSLRDALVNGPYDLEAAANLVDQISSGLIAAHRRTVIHRDLKPANILLDEDGNAYLADFGIAKDLTLMNDSVTEPDQLIGSPDYLAPEQARAEAVTPQTDIYSLGVVLYEMLTGEHPYPGLSPVERLFKHLNEPIPPIKTLDSRVADDVNAVIQRATAKNPAHRFADVVEMAAAFRQAAALSVTHAGDRLVELLTPREQEILKMLIEGKSNREIAQTLVVELSTVKWHITQIYQKLNVRSRVQAIVRARELNLIVPDRTADTSITFSVLPEPKNPYKGLRAFEAADEQDFFGREKLTRKLLKRLEEKDALSRFLAVVGPSGSGKSSVVKAGLIPALWRGEMSGSEKWFIVEMIPGGRPIDELEIALLRIASNQTLDLRAQLERDEHGLIRAAQLLLPDDGSDLLLVIDQFEEVFTLVESEPERQQFLDLIQAAVTDPRSRVRVLVTMRADFYDRPLQYPKFGELVRSRMETILPLTAEELERAISQPAERVGLSFEEGLVASIISDVHYQPGGLPLLQYALTELFESRDGRTLTHEAYQQIGRAVGALAKRAEDLYGELTEAGQEAVRQMFLRLVTPGDGTEDARRRVSRAELLSMAGDPDLMDEVIDTFATYRLLSLDRDLSSNREPTVEVAHEALLREWERLREWLNESRQEIRLQRQLSTLAAEWQQAGRDASYLASGSRLEQFEVWAQETELTLTPIERDYLSESAAEHERQVQAKSEQQAREAKLEQRSRTVLRALVGVFAVAALVAGGLALWAFQQRQEARRQASIGFAAQAKLELDGAAPERSVLLALEALEHYPYTWQAEEVLGQIVREYRLRSILTGHRDTVLDVTWSPDGTRIATTGLDGTLRLWDAETHTELLSIQAHEGNLDDLGLRVGVQDLAWSPDGARIATASKDGVSKIWNVATGHKLVTLTGHTDWVSSVNWSPDGARIATASKDGTVRVWDAASGDELLTISEHTDWVKMVAWSPDGTRLATASDDKTARIWDAKTGEALLSLSHQNWVWSVAWSPDGSQLASASEDGTVRVWDSTSGDEVSTIRLAGPVWEAAWSPDGTQLATSSAPGLAQVWDAASQNLSFTLQGRTPEQFNVAWSPDGKQLATTAGTHFTVRIWDTSSPDVTLAGGHTAGISWVEWSPDGKRIVTGANDNTAVIWEAETGDQLLTLAGHAPINMATWSPDGNRIVTTAFESNVKVWDANTGKELLNFLKHDGEGSSFWMPDTIGVWGGFWSPDGTRVMTSGITGSVRVWDPSTGEELLSFLAQEGGPGALGNWSPDGKRLATCATSPELLQTWDAASGEPLLGGPAPKAAGSDLAFQAFCMRAYWSPDGKKIVTVEFGNDNSATVWDAETGKQLVLFLEHTSGVVIPSWSPNGKRIATPDGSGVVKVWDAATGDVVLSFSQPYQDYLYNVDWSPDGKWLIASNLLPSVSTYRVWQSTNDLIAYAKDCCVVRELTPEERERFGLPERPGTETTSTSQPRESRLPAALPFAFSLMSGALALVGARRLRSQR